MHATAGSHDTIYHLILCHDVDVLFFDRRRALSDSFVNLPVYS